LRGTEHNFAACTHSIVSPLLENSTTISPDLIDPKSPWPHSTAWTLWLGQPKDIKHAMWWIPMELNEAAIRAAT
jgi:hypothetical protein